MLVEFNNYRGASSTTDYRKIITTFLGMGRSAMVALSRFYGLPTFDVRFRGFNVNGRDRYGKEITSAGFAHELKVTIKLKTEGVPPNLRAILPDEVCVRQCVPTPHDTWLPGGRGLNEESLREQRETILREAQGKSENIVKLIHGKVISALQDRLEKLA